MTNKFDSLLEQLGTGKWNLIAIGLLSYWSMQIPVHAVGATFLTPTLNHSCRIPPGGTPLITEDNDNQTIVDTCWYLRDVQNKTEKFPCTEWDFDNSTYKSTLTSEFQLVCGDEYLKPNYQSSYIFGALVASGVIGHLSDSYGRKTVLSFGMIFYTVFGNLINWLPNIPSILVARFIQGLMHPTSISVVYTLAMEQCQPKHRAVVGILSFFPWVIGFLVLAGEAYLIREWRWLMFVGPIPAILTLPILWFTDESPRWLILKGQHDKAIRILQKAARLNKGTLPPEDELRTLMMDIEVESNKSKSPVKTDSSRIIALLRLLWDETYILFRTKAIRRITLCIYCVFFVSGMVYYGLSLSGADFGSDPFIYMALSGVMEIPGSTITLPVVNYIGRRLSGIICYLITGVSLLLLTVIPRGSVATAFALIGKMTISAAYQIIYLHATELYPTQVRVRGLGTSALVSKIGSVSIPYLINALGAIYWWAPSVVCGAVSIMACMVWFLLPETLSMALPDTVADLEDHPMLSKRRQKAKRKENESPAINPEEKIPLSN